MAAPDGNNFWQFRSKHGRDKIFETAELLLQEAYKYFQWCVDNPLIAIEYYGKDAQKCEVPKMRAFTIQGLCNFLRVNTEYLHHFLKHQQTLDTKEAKDFCHTITHIKEIIYRQKFEGAAAGFLNANLIARELGISEKSEHEHSGGITINGEVKVINTGSGIATSESNVDV